MRNSTGPELLVGQEPVLRALAASMQRGVLAAGGALAVVATVGGALATGAAGAVSALGGALLGVAASMITPWLVRRTADREPRAVMVASLAGFLQKMIVLLVALFVAGSIPGVQRTALAVGLLVVLVGVTVAEGWAGYRLWTAVVDLPSAGSGTTTSASVSGSSVPPAHGGRGGGGAGNVAGERRDHPS